MQPADLPPQDTNAIKQESLLSDLAFVSGHGSHGGWLLLWSESTGDGDERRYLAGETEEQFGESMKLLNQSGFREQFKISVFIDSDGVRRYSGMFRKSTQQT
ncbi:MAG: hypothetical protein ACKPHU_11395, partial [Planctomycetaceae bacterium]